MVVEKRKRKKERKNSVELVASLAPAWAEVGAVAKADQQKGLMVINNNKLYIYVIENMVQSFRITNTLEKKF